MRAFRILAVVLMMMFLTNAVGAGDPEGSFEGTMTANGETVGISHVYVYAEKEGFYDEADPTWKLIFVSVPIEERELDEHIWDAAYLELGITETATFGDAPEIQVYSQNMVFSPDQGGNVSGGEYPSFELTESGEDRWVGRVWHEEPQTIFDHTFHYDFTFTIPMSDPFAPIGDPLPPGGGEPGAAYLAFCAAVHSGEMDQLKALMPAEQAAMFDDPSIKDQIKEEIEFMKLMTPTDIEILSGSSDGETAILKVKGKMDGEEVKGEITMTLHEGLWMSTSESW